MKFKIRCSAIGKIMSNDLRITQGNATYLKTWLKEKLYQREKSFTSKYCDKGNINEDESIEFIGKILGLTLEKNTQDKENEYFTGTCDILQPKMIIDVKNSWDCFTFPLFEEVTPNKDYIYQLQGYMDLYNRSEAKLIYTLTDTPLSVLSYDITQYMKDHEVNYSEAEQRVLSYHTYSNVPDNLKYKEFIIKKDEETIEKIKNKVKVCQLYINQLVDQLNIKEF